MANTSDNRHNSAFSRRFMMVVRLAIIVILIVSFLVVFSPLMGLDTPLTGLTVYLFVFFAIVGFCVLLISSLGIFEGLNSSRWNKRNSIVVDSLDDAVALTDFSGNVFDCNEAFRQLDDYKPKQNLLLTLSKLHDVERVLYKLTVKAGSSHFAREEVRSYSHLWPIEGHDKQSQYSLSAKKVFHNGREFLLWRLQDVSFAYEQQEPAFQNIQEAINHLDRAPAGFAVLDESGAILYINATLANWLDLDLSKFVAGKFEFDNIFNENSQKQQWSDIAQQIRQSDGLYKFSLFANTETVSDKAFVTFATFELGGDDDNTLYRLVLMPASFESVSKDVRASSSEQLFNYYFENTQFAVAMIDQTGCLLRLNDRFKSLFGTTVLSDEKQLFSSLAVESEREGVNQIIGKVVAGSGLKQSFEITLNIDSKRHFKIQIVGLPGGMRKFDGGVAIISAIETTEQKTLEDKMAQGQKLQAVGQLAGGIAHDFNNVLTAILMSCDLLLANHRSSDPAYADLNNIKNNANRAASLVQQLLAFSRRQTLRPEVVDLTELLSDVRNLLTPLLGSNVQLKFNHGRDLWHVKLDQSSFQRVLMNLVINARDAMPQGGSITVATANVTQAQSEALPYSDFVSGEYVELAVEDTGTGIPKSVQEKMFEPFFTTKEVGKGTGLGLSMVYGIVKQSGGYIYCDSDEGRGTTFRIYLPRYVASSVPDVVADEQKNDDVKAQIEKNADLSGTATVLLVEDEAAVRMGGVRALQSRGYTVLEAENGLEALEIIEEQQGAVDLVVSDVVMPEMDGPTLLGELRKRYPEIKFVFVSGYAKDAFAKNLPEDAVFGFLAKPFTLKQLALKVKEMLTDENSEN